MSAHPDLHVLTAAWKDPVAARVMRDLAASSREARGEEEPGDPLPVPVSVAPAVLAPAMPAIDVPDNLASKQKATSRTLPIVRFWR